MAMMEWNDALKLGHSAIDHDHRKLVGLINELGDAMSTGHGSSICGNVLAELVNYTRTHFAMEERLMALHHYPGASAHKAEHAKLIQEVVDFQYKFNAGTAAISVAVLHFLMDWLTHHILESDKALAKAIPKD